jgi:hypothetical protein
MILDYTDKEARVIKRMIRRNLIRNMRALDWKIDNAMYMCKKMYKGIGDLIGITLAAAGAATFVIAVLAADSIPNKWMVPHMAIMVLSLLATLAGAALLKWMRH